MEFTGSKKVKNPLPVRVILVGTEHSMNLGMAARVCKNFSVIDLALVNPKCTINFEAMKYAMHSHEVLENAKVFANLTDATAGFDLVIGTTGVVRRFTNSLKNCMPLPEVTPLVKGRKVAIVFGSEGIGLSKADLIHCDLITTIPAERSHPILNLSHSVAIVLYSLFHSSKTSGGYRLATGKQVKSLNSLFSNIVNYLVSSDVRPRLRDPAKAKIAFKRVLGRSASAETEVQTLLAVLAQVNKNFAKRNKK